MHEESRGSDALQIAFEAAWSFAAAIFFTTMFGDAVLFWRALAELAP